jgi:hypothetical protein
VFARACWTVLVVILTVGCANALAPSTPSSPAPSRSPGTSTPAATGHDSAPPLASPSRSDGYTRPSATFLSDDRADLACSAILHNIPVVSVNSGEPRLAAAYEVTGAQLTNYFVTILDADPDQSNGSDWWDEPEKLVDLCLYDGDFTTMTPGPEGNDTSATRVLVVISDRVPEFWARTRDSAAIPATDPATMSH